MNLGVLLMLMNDGSIGDVMMILVMIVVDVVL